MKASLVVTTFVVALLLRADTFATITIDMVPIGDVGNPNDPVTGNLYGGVNYGYSIGKYEVTVSQYATFLNAVATTDAYFLYNVNMANAVNAGIARSGTPGHYHYSHWLPEPSRHVGKLG
jgi:formylglycine-generating enzyme